MKAVHGFALYERIDGLKIRHFRHTVIHYETAIARIHDLVRNKRWNETRIFEIWDGITAISKITCTRIENHVDIVSKPYLLEPSCKKEAIGYESDVYEASKYKRIIRTGRQAGDLTSWIKKEAIDKVPCMMIDKDNYSLTQPNYTRSLRK